MSKTIRSVSLKNFKQCKEISVSFDDSLTFLMGGNGDGKTTIGLDGIQYLFEGAASRPASKDRNPLIGERFTFIHKGEKSAVGRMVIHDDKLNCDIIVKRKITATSNELEFEAPEGMKLDQNWLSSLFSYYMISPRAFIRLTPKDQAIALGLDLSSFDKDLKTKKEEYTQINAVLRSLGDVGAEPENPSPVVISSILDELEQINEHNSTVNEYEKNIEEANRRIAEIETQLKKLQESRHKLVEYIKTTQNPGERISIDGLNESITNVETINAKAREHEQWVKADELKQAQEQKLAKNKEQQDTIMKNRLEAIKGAELPFDELNVDDQGNLTLDGRFINDNQFSTGELMKIVPMLMSKIKGADTKIKYVYIQDFSLMDETNQKITVDYLINAGFQVCAEIVGTKEVEKGHVIQLKEMKIVKEDNV